MLKKLTLVGAAFAMGATSLVLPAAPAEAAQRWGHHDRYDRHDRWDRDDRRYYRDRRYYSRRAREKCADGDGGTIVGAIAGGLLGRAIDTRGDRMLGTILGAGAGALAGREIDRSDRPGYCRR